MRACPMDGRLRGFVRKVRKGATVALNQESINCGGGKHYLGYDDLDDPAYAKTEEPNFMELFLAQGVPGVVEGERFKKSPQHSRSYCAGRKEFSAPARYGVFKLLSALEADELSFAVPWERLKVMFGNLEESYLGGE